MKISEAFKALSDQHLQEQNLLSKGLSTSATNIKAYFEDRKAKKEACMKSMQSELLSKKIESKIPPKAEKQKPQMKI